ncbi:DUF5666 domain-containing protein [Helicobacter salomonis]|uniref:DUF5666 domain-containing protein n=1 Tax=Helicobacter salomonis TaxID=56878 RepID=UPI000CF05BBA|nr:DUF5666 domain-containing protein [Helicobacter salomonis]
MKKVLMGLLVAGLGSLYASDFKGIIEEVNDAQKTIAVNGMVIGVMPYTKIEQDSCGMGWDSAKKFADLKKGDLVKVDLIHHQATPVAEEIEIKCMQHRAY